MNLAVDLYTLLLFVSESLWRKIRSYARNSSFLSVSSLKFPAFSAGIVKIVALKAIISATTIRTKASRFSISAKNLKPSKRSSWSNVLWSSSPSWSAICLTLSRVEIFYNMYKNYTNLDEKDVFFQNCF